jgi:hypothetical protein
MVRGGDQWFERGKKRARFRRGLEHFPVAGDYRASQVVLSVITVGTSKMNL